MGGPSYNFQQKISSKKSYAISQIWALNKLNKLNVHWMILYTTESYNTNTVADASLYWLYFGLNTDFFIVGNGWDPLSSVFFFQHQTWRMIFEIMTIAQSFTLMSFSFMYVYTQCSTSLVYARSKTNTWK